MADKKDDKASTGVDLNEVTDIGGLTKNVNKAADPVATVAGATDDIAVGARAAVVAVDKNASQEERHDATREAGRKIGKVGTAGAVTAGSQAALVVETGGTSLAGAAATYGTVDAVNEVGAKVLNTFGAAEIQKAMGLGDGTKYESLTDVASDAVTHVAGDQIAEMGSNIVPEGMPLEEVEMGLGGIAAAAGTVENVSAGQPAVAHADMVAEDASKVGLKHGVIDETQAADIKDVGGVVQNLSDMTSLNTQSISSGAEASKNVTNIAERHEVIDSTMAEDLRTGADVVKTGANVAGGELSTATISDVTNTTGKVVDRAEAHEFIDQDTSATIKQGTQTVGSTADLAGSVQNLGNGDISKLTSMLDQNSEPPFDPNKVLESKPKEQTPHAHSKMEAMNTSFKEKPAPEKPAAAVEDKPTKPKAGA